MKLKKRQESKIKGKGFSSFLLMCAVVRSVRGCYSLAGPKPTLQSISPVAKRRP